jgi:hypothetical protein
VCQLQVQVNKQVVALPYQKYGLQVYESGINFVVEIPELGALISYNGLSFSIKLPYHLFGNNTKGQCGELWSPPDPMRGWVQASYGFPAPLLHSLWHCSRFGPSRS